MIEFIQREVFAFEEDEASRSKLLQFFLNGHRMDLVAIYKEGVFRHLVTYEAFLQHRYVSDKYVVLSDRIFEDAISIFGDSHNRILYLPVVDAYGALLSIIRWNNQIKEADEPVQNNEIIEQAEVLYLDECSDKILKWLQIYLQTHSGKTFLLSGEGWEVLSYGSLIEAGNNTVVLCTDETDIEDALQISFVPEPVQYDINTVKTIWQLNEKFLSYRIFVGPYNNGGMELLTILAVDGICCDGIWDYEIDNTTLFGKPVKLLDELLKEEDVIIVYLYQSEAEFLEKKQWKNAIILHFDSLFEISTELYSKENVIVYDSVNKMKQAVKLLEKHNCSIAHTIDIRDNRNDEVKAILDADKYNIILESNTEYVERVIKNNVQFSKFVYSTRKNIIRWIEGSCFIITTYSLNEAYNQRKRIILYGLDGIFTNNWMQLFFMLDINLYKIVEDKPIYEKGIESVYELMYEESDIYVVVNKKLSEWDNARSIINDLCIGGRINIDCIGLYDLKTDLSIEGIKDSLLGFKYNSLYGYDGEDIREAFDIYGIQDENDYKILTLGGSTTMGWPRYIPSWSQLLYNKLKENGYSVTIYNGGVDSYSACQELYKLIRDGNVIRPDMVISFSGVNNVPNLVHPVYTYVPKPLIDIFDGIGEKLVSNGLKQKNKSYAAIWAEQQQMIASISMYTYGAKFYSFAQPLYLAKENLTISERLQFIYETQRRKDVLEYRREVEGLSKEFDWMIDIQGLLDDRPDVFYDAVHVYEDGNRIIADEIYSHIIKDIKR